MTLDDDTLYTSWLYDGDHWSKTINTSFLLTEKEQLAWQEYGIRNNKDKILKHGFAENVIYTKNSLFLPHILHF